MPKKINRDQMIKVKRMLMTKQMGACPLCGCNLTALPPENVVVDHDHDTGIIRGLLCRGCNGAEGKVKNSINRWGKTKDIVGYMKRLIEYYEWEPTGYIYPDHQNENEKRLARNRKARKKYRDKKMLELREKLLNKEVSDK